MKKMKVTAEINRKKGRLDRMTNEEKRLKSQER